MSDTADTLRGVVARLAAHFVAAQRNMERWDEAKLRHEVAAAAAVMDVVRPLLGEEAIARHAEEALEKVQPRSVVEVDSLTGFGLWAEGYDEDDNALIMLEEPVLERMIGDVAGLRVLDVGCGTGRWARRLAARGAAVTGIDPCPEMLAVAKARAEAEEVRVKFVEGELGGLPRGKQFDLVLCNLVLSHLTELGPAVAEMAGCLRPGGRIITSDFHYMCLVIGWRTAFRHEGQRYHIENYQHTYGDYLKAFEAAGLRVTAIEDVMIDESLRGRKDSLLDGWEGFPFGMVVAGVKAV